MVGGVVDESKKSCSICGTEKTPLWRSGPAGPKVQIRVLVASNFYQGFLR